MSGYIYEMTTGPYRYIGQTVDPATRESAHSSKLLKGRHTKLVQRAFRKYKEMSFRIILECEESELDSYENQLISKIWNSPYCLNTLKEAGPPAWVDENPRAKKLRHQRWGYRDHIQSDWVKFETKQQLADYVGVTLSTVRSWLRGSGGSPGPGLLRDFGKPKP